MEPVPEAMVLTPLVGLAGNRMGAYWRRLELENLSRRQTTKVNEEA